MEILEGRVLMKRLLERYSADPKQWSFTVGRAGKDGFFDALIANPNESWQVKLDSIYKPLPLMLGAKVDIDYSKVKPQTPISYGYRKLSPEILMKILTGLSAADESPRRKRVPPELNLDSILGSLDTVVHSDAGGGSYAEGPYVFTNEKLSSFSAGQEQLNDKLSTELRKLVRNRFPSYL